MQNSEGIKSNLRPRVIVSLLVDDGRLVKTIKFANPKYVGDPINAVKIFNEKNVDELVIYDVSATNNKKINYPLLEKIAKEARMPLCYGGYIDSGESAVSVVSLGFEKVSVSTAALLNPNLIKEISQRIGSQSTIVTLDVKDRLFKSGWSVYCSNGKKKIPISLDEILTFSQENGAGEIIINSIHRDGVCGGYDIDLCKYVFDNTKIPVTFLGGAGNSSHLIEISKIFGSQAGIAAGSMFVFKGIHRAVLISYSNKLD